MEKIYIVEDTDRRREYQLLDEPSIISAYSTKEKALEFINERKKDILEEDGINVRSDTGDGRYFYAESDCGWHELILLERDLN